MFLALALLAFAVCSGLPTEAFFVLRYIGSFGGGFFLAVLSGRMCKCMKFDTAIQNLSNAKFSPKCHEIDGDFWL